MNISIAKLILTFSSIIVTELFYLNILSPQFIFLMLLIGIIATIISIYKSSFVFLLVNIVVLSIQSYILFKYYF